MKLVGDKHVTFYQW